MFLCLCLGEGVEGERLGRVEEECRVGVPGEGVAGGSDYGTTALSAQPGQGGPVFQQACQATT